MNPKNVVLDRYGRIVMQLDTLGACLAVAAVLDTSGQFGPYTTATLEPINPCRKVAA